MGDLKTQNTSYPDYLDTATLISDNGSDEIVAAHQNGPNSAIIAIEEELGVNLKGTSQDLAARLQVMLDGDGGLLRGNNFPASPPLTPHLFYRTDTKKLYIYNTSTDNYDVVPTTVTLSDYVEKATQNTITAVHTLNPAVTGAPFIVGANAAGQLVTGFNADEVDGYHHNQDLRTTSSPTFSVITASATGTTAPLVVASTTKVANLNADLIDNLHATSANTASTVVARDGSGNFSASVITANLTGNASGLDVAIHDVTASRAFTTVYQNTTGKVLWVSVTANTGATTYGTNMYGYVGPTSTPAFHVSSDYGGTSAMCGMGVMFPVPINYYYKVTVDQTSSLAYWMEFY